MGFKNVKEAYGICHSVQIREGKICIGSPYVSDLISITMDGVPKWGTLGPSKNDDLARYWKEMNDDLPKLRALIEAPDTFKRSLPVFTYDGGTILEKQCEKRGWPNVTHDGCMMYDNTFFADREKAIAAGIRNANAGIELMTDVIARTRKELREREQVLAEMQAELKSLESA